MMDNSRLTVLCLFAFIGLFVFCEGLSKGEAGVCEDFLMQTIRKTYSYRCGRRLCRKVKVTRVRDPNPTPVCCVKWEYDVEKDKCKPLCMNECSNGYCVAPDTCACNPPLILHNNTICSAPICDPPCFNGECVADNTCICTGQNNYINATHCAEPCEEDYFNDPHSLECLPRCNSPCNNGTCTGPNTCTCRDGFALNPSDIFSCIPDCNPRCENSICVAPNKCECMPGYKFENVTKCVPECEACEQGVCVGPNECQCHDGYSMKDGKCTPTCEKPCSNGTCTAPDTCTCDSGFTIDLNDKFKCNPVCDPQCQNSNCTSPNKCTCWEGYRKTNSSTCKAKCDNCEHGTCAKPNECKCNDKYTLVNGICSPVCEQPCQNGYCTAPDVCTCNTGYKASKTKNICDPICDFPCFNSTCVSPNTCSCLPGYKKTSVSNNCEPNCSGCTNGDCIAPEACICHDGYSRHHGDCLPICENPCINGNCTNPNECNCNQGYIQDESSPHICYKICSDGRRCVDDQCCIEPIVECRTCNGSCTDGICYCSHNNYPCYEIDTNSQELTNTGLAGLQLTWMFAAGIGFLLTVVLVVVIIYMHRKRRAYETKIVDGNTYGSVIFTAPDMLMRSNTRKICEELERATIPKTNSEPLLSDDGPRPFNEAPVF